MYFLVFRIGESGDKKQRETAESYC